MISSVLHDRHKSATHHTSSSASSAKLKSTSSTRHLTRFKHHYKHTRTNRRHKARLVFTAFPANAVKYTSERQDAAYLQESRNGQAHGRQGHLDKSAIIKHSHEQDHRNNWNKTKLIAPVQFWHQRRVREATEIKSHNTVPQDIGFFINDIWSPLLKPTLPTAARLNTDTLQRTHIQPATNSHVSPGKHNLNPSRPKCASLQPYLSLSIISRPAFS